MKDSTVALFCCLDDFAKICNDWQQHHWIPSSSQRQRAGKLCLGEMPFIMVLFHLSAYRDFKHFWRYGVEQEFRHCFAQLPSQGRFVALMPRLLRHQASDFLCLPIDSQPQVHLGGHGLGWLGLVR